MYPFKEPALLASLVVAAGWYTRGAKRPKLYPVPRRRRTYLPAVRTACFYTGLLTIGIALDSPLDDLADKLFWAHMLQHVLLLTAAAPLIALGAPWLPFWRPLPLGFRRRAAHAFATGSLVPVRRTAAVLATPIAAWLLFNVDIAVWHVPWMYDLTVRENAVHYVEHISFIIFGVLYWAHALDSPPLHRQINRIRELVYLVSAATASWLLAIVLAVAPRPLYGVYVALHHRPGGISALADQQLAAGVMLGPGSVAFAIAVFYGIYAWLGAEEKPRPARLAVR
jgi:cytochrome c oxidase assembly factor CtaG